MNIARILIGLAVVSIGAYAQSNTIKSVRTWSQNDVTRAILEFSEDVEFTHQRIANPGRVFLDFPATAINLENAPGKKYSTISVQDTLIQNIRVAESQPGAVRVVFDLTNGKADYTVTELANPYRVVVEFRSKGGTSPALVAGKAAPAKKPSAPPPPRITVEEMRKAAEKAAATGKIPQPPVSRPAQVSTKTSTPGTSSANSAKQSDTASLPSAIPEPLEETESGEKSVVASVARPASLSSRSMTRALGLKLNKIVLDPGHGGHDYGTSSRAGLHEKDLVLDIAKRLGALLEDGMGSEVAYTRTDDTYIPLEQRTAFANQQRADLFISIHANSSPSKVVAGPETFFLNFTSSRDATDVAARENASSGKTIFELQDLVKKITLNEKLTESREFAAKVQASLREVSGKGKDRGVKRAPFVVLIGASMPSILTEVGFLSNVQEAAQLSKPAYRQKVAEALYEGISKYAQTLSHFQMATREDKKSGSEAR